MTEGQINHNFTYHKPKDDQPERYEKIRAEARNLALFINENVPESREKELFFTHLETAIFWANAGIARNE
jgi:hypothetical protein